MKIFVLSLMVFGIAGVLTPVNAQRGYPHYYARAYRGYHAYNYSRPVFIQNYYRPVVFGPRYYRVPRGSISITFGGNAYFYFGGTFYTPFGGYYRSIFPPIGIHIGVLPYGCFTCLCMT